MIFSIFAIIVLLVSGHYHESLYILFFILGISTIYFNDFRIYSNKVITAYFFFLISLFILMVFQIIFFIKFEFHYINGVGRIFVYLLFALFIVNRIKHEDLKKAVYLIIYIVLVLTPLGILELGTGIGTRYQLFFDHPNHFAYVLILLIFFILKERSFIEQNWLILGGLLLNLLLTKSSGAILTVFIMFVYKFYFQTRASIQQRLIISSIPIIFLAVSFYFFSDRLVGQLSSFFDNSFHNIYEEAVARRFGGQGSLFWRVTYWLALLIEFSQGGWGIYILGGGVDCMTVGNYWFEFMSTDPHNDYIKYLMEGGIAGISAFLGFLFLLFRSLKFDGLLMIAVLLPMMVGNIIVNFPYNIVLIIILLYFADKDDSNFKKTVKHTPETSS